MLSSEDVRENPGTLGLAASWLGVFLLILLFQWFHPAPLPPVPVWEPLKVATLTGHRFGDMTWLEVRQGQVWRLLTATFIHFGLVHVGLNTLALVNLGRLVEPWYRTGPFLAICVMMGGLGNLVGGSLRQLVGLARPWLAEVAVSRHWPKAIENLVRGGGSLPETVPSGGGSTILLGLLALCAVVGWRSRTRVGEHLGRQMMILLGVTAAMGLAMPGLVDNFGHLGGTLVGGALGLFDRSLVRLSNSGRFRNLCLVLALGVSTACLGAAIRNDRAESIYSRELEDALTSARAAQSTLAALSQLHYLYADTTLRPDGVAGRSLPLEALAVSDLMSRGPHAADPAKSDPELAKQAPTLLAGSLDRLDHIVGKPWGDQVAADIARVVDLARNSVANPPTFERIYEFAYCWRSAEKAVAADLARLNARLVELESARKAGR